MNDDNSGKYNFFLKGGDTAVLLIHGITGTPSEMRYYAKALNKAGFTVYCNTLPRHCSTLNDLKKVTWQEIVDACIEDFKFLKQQYPKVFVGGISMGALMGIHLAYLFPSEVSGVIALAPTLFYDGWALHKGKVLMDIMWHIPFIRDNVSIREGWPYGLKDEESRENIERFYRSSKGRGLEKKALLFGSPFFPLANLYQHHLFTEVVKKELSSVKTPIMVIHAKEDDMTSIKNAHFVLEHIGSSDKTFIELDNSYHMITIDNDKDKVAEESVKFLNKLK